MNDQENPTYFGFQPIPPEEKAGKVAQAIETPEKIIQDSIGKYLEETRKNITKILNPLLKVRPKFADGVRDLRLSFADRLPIS